MEFACLQFHEICKEIRLVCYWLPEIYKSLSKRCSFTLQKGTFYTSKGHLLPCKRASFTLQKSTFCDWVVNLSYKRGGGEIKQSTSDLFKDYQYRFLFFFIVCGWFTYNWSDDTMKSVQIRIADASSCTFLSKERAYFGDVI